MSDSHPLEGQIDDVVDLIDTEPAAGDLLLIGNQFVLLVDVIGHNINIHQRGGLFQDRRYLFGEFTDLFQVVPGHLYHNRRQGRRTGRLLHKLDDRTRNDRFTGLFDHRTEPMDHHVGGLVSFMFVGQIHSNLGDVFTVFHPGTFDQPGIVEGDSHPGVDLHVGDLRLLFEMFHDTASHLVGLIDGTAGGGLDIDREGIVALTRKHLGFDDLGGQQHHRSRQGHQGQKDHQCFFAFALQDGMDEVLKFFHL